MDFVLFSNYERQVETASQRPYRHRLEHTVGPRSRPTAIGHCVMVCHDGANYSTTNTSSVRSQSKVTIATLFRAEHCRFRGARTWWIGERRNAIALS